MNTDLIAAEELVRVDGIVASLRALDATEDGHEALAMAQAGFTHPDQMN